MTSASTTEGSSGGQQPSLMSARMAAATSWFRLARQLTPPESETSTVRSPWEPACSPVVASQRERHLAGALRQVVGAL
ncbi:MAG: hypothetical protein ACP5P1_05480 [Acidimicrobiales bacterium]